MKIGVFAARMIRQHRRIEREPDERDAQQSDAREPQARMRHAMKQPQQCRAFERPADRDPLAIKLDRENQRDKKQRHAAEPRELRQPRFAFGRNIFRHDCEADEGRNCKRRGQQAHDIIRPGRRDEAMDEEELRHAGQCRRRPGNHRVTEFFRNRNGNSANTPRNIRYQTSGMAADRDVKMIEVPRTFERGHADESDGRQPVERKKSGHAQQQPDEQQCEAENWRRIGERQS